MTFASHLIRFLPLSLFLAVMATPVTAVTPTPTQILTAHENGVPAARFFGQSMASNGSVLAIGAPQFSGGGATVAPGVVLLYQRVGGVWTFMQALQAPVPGNSDGFGHHLAFAGNQLLVSAPFSSVNGVVERGAVHVYQPVTNVYTHLQTIDPGIALSLSDWFAFHSSADGGWLALGVPLRGALDPGQVQLYYQDPDNGQWIYHSLLNGTANNGRFGIRVLMRGTRLLVAATEEVSSGNNRGYVYEFLRSGAGAAATWAQVQRFRLNGTGISVFGSALALSPNGNKLLVGAPFQTTPDGQTQVGTVVAFERTMGGSWTETARIAPPSTAQASNFGASVAFSGDQHALIGDIRERSSGLLTGGAHAFRDFTPNNWTRVTSWARGPGVDSDFMGGAIIAIGNQVLVSAPGIDVGASLNEGQVFVFDDALPLLRDGFE